MRAVDPAHASSWPPLLFLEDLYIRSVLTMGDDKFFSASLTNVPCNPPTLDELTSWHKLLNIAFTLYWREDYMNVQRVGCRGVNLKWKGVREKVTRYFFVIHARE